MIPTDHGGGDEIDAGFGAVRSGVQRHEGDTDQGVVPHPRHPVTDDGGAHVNTPGASIAEYLQGGTGTEDGARLTADGTPKALVVLEAQTVGAYSPKGVTDDADHQATAVVAPRGQAHTCFTSPGGGGPVRRADAGHAKVGGHHVQIWHPDEAVAVDVSKAGGVGRCRTDAEVGGYEIDIELIHFVVGSGHT